MGIAKDFSASAAMMFSDEHPERFSAPFCRAPFYLLMTSQVSYTGLQGMAWIRRRVGEVRARIGAVCTNIPHTATRMNPINNMPQ